MFWQNKRASSPVIATNVFLSNATKSHAWETWSHFHVIFCTAKNIQLSQNEFSFLPDLFWFLSFGQNNDHGESILLLIEWRLMVVAIISQVFLHIFFPAKDEKREKQTTLAKTCQKWRHVEPLHAKSGRYLRYISANFFGISAKF